MGILSRQEQFATKADFKVLSLGVRTQLDHLDQKVSRFEVRMTADIAGVSEEGPCAVYNLGLGLTPRANQAAACAPQIGRLAQW